MVKVPSGAVAKMLRASTLNFHPSHSMRTDGMPIDASSSRAVSMAKRSLSATVIGKRDDMGEIGAKEFLDRSAISRTRSLHVHVLCALKLTSRHDEHHCNFRGLWPPTLTPMITFTFM